MSPSVASDRPRRVAIVGNAPTHGWGERIDSSDWVVRFNNAPGYERHTGRRVTHLALVNHGGQMAEWLAEPGFLERPVVKRANAFLLPFARKAEQSECADGRDWTDDAIGRLAPLGRPVAILPEAVRKEAREIVGNDGRTGPAPSTGLLATLHVLRSLGTASNIDIYGFGFSGWSGHAFDRERAFFESMRRAGRLALHPLRHANHA